jgi:hypothetical protein
VQRWASEGLYNGVLKAARTEAKSRFPFYDYDYDELNRLLHCLYSLIPLAKNGSDLIKVGNAIAAVQNFKEGSRAKLNLDIGCQESYENAFSEPEFAFARFREDSITLLFMDARDPLIGKNKLSFPTSSYELYSDRWFWVFERVRKTENVKLKFESFDE